MEDKTLRISKVGKNISNEQNYAGRSAQKFNLSQPVQATVEVNYDDIRGFALPDRTLAPPSEDRNQFGDSYFYKLHSERDKTHVAFASMDDMEDFFRKAKDRGYEVDGEAVLKQKAKEIFGLAEKVQSFGEDRAKG